MVAQETKRKVYKHTRTTFEVRRKNSLFQEICFLFAKDADVNSLFPNYTMQYCRTQSTLTQVMAYFLATPSYCMNQCWQIICEVLCHSFKGNVTRDTSIINYRIWLENYVSKIMKVNVEYHLISFFISEIVFDDAWYLRRNEIWLICVNDMLCAVHLIIPGCSYGICLVYLELFVVYTWWFE